MKPARRGALPGQRLAEPGSPSAHGRGRWVSGGAAVSRGLQAKVSAINALNQVFMSLNPSLLQPTEAPLAAGWATMLDDAPSYWKTACSHEASCMVMVE